MSSSKPSLTLGRPASFSDEDLAAFAETLYDQMTEKVQEQEQSESPEVAELFFEHASDAALGKYLAQHPGADPSRHTVKAKAEREPELEPEQTGDGTRQEWMSKTEAAKAEQSPSQKETMGELKELATSEPLYLRWGFGPTADVERKQSRDAITHELHSGLSAIAIDPTWSNEKMAVRIDEYKTTALSGKPTQAWLYRGKQIGVDSDGHPSIVITGVVGQPGQRLLKGAAEYSRQRREWDDLTRSPALFPVVRERKEKALAAGPPLYSGS